MIFKKFKTIYQAYRNIDAYEDLLNARLKLESTNDLISQKEQKIQNLNKEYTTNKERATLACFTPEELLQLQNAKINTIAAKMIDKFNTQLRKETDVGNDHFIFTVEYPEQIDIKALKFIAAKLQTEGFKTRVSNIVYPPGMYMGQPPWEIYMYVSIPEPSLLNRIVDALSDKPRSRKPN